MSPKKAKSNAAKATTTKRTLRPKKIQTTKRSNENVPSVSVTSNEETNASVDVTNELNNGSKIPAKKGRPQKRSSKTNRRKAISQERLQNVINEMGVTVGVCNTSDERSETENEEMSTSEINSNPASEQRTVYSCKFCKKDFSSAFILCLHLRIHEKVGNVNESNEDNFIENSDNQKSFSSESHIKEEIVEEVTLTPSDIDSDMSETNRIQTPPKNQVIGIINKNFVENLKKNLSLAMNRQIN